jgi:hypothetical protein
LTLFSGKLSSVMSTPEESLPPMPLNRGEPMAGESPQRAASPQLEIGGREGPEPTRFGDWELRGRCIDF